MRQGADNFTYRVPTRWLTAGSLAGLAAGLAAGIAANRSGSPFAMASARAFELVGMLWTNALQMVVYPLIVSLLIVAVGSIGPTRRAGRMGATSFSLFFLFLAAAAVFTMLAAPALIRWMPIEPGTLEVLGAAGLDEGVTAARQAPGIADWIVGLVPENPLRAAADGEILSVVFFCLLFGFAVGRLPVERRRPVLGFFDGMAGASMVLVVWILWAIPLAAFAIAFSVSTKVGVQAAGVLGYFVLLVSVLLILFTLAIYPISAVLAGIPLSRFARAVVPAQVVALGSRSSLASLPALLEGARERLGIPDSVAGFVLPLSVSTFKVNRTISSPFKLLFLAHVYGVAIEPGYLLVLVATVMVLSFSSPGIPSGGFLVTLPFYVSAGIPVEGVILLRVVDAVPDIFKTLVNVTADMSVAAVAARADERRA